MKIIFAFLMLFSFCADAQNTAVVELSIDEQEPDLFKEEDVAAWTTDDVEKKHLENFDFNKKDKKGNTVLYYTLNRNPNLEVSKKIIENGADVNTPSGSDILPINIVTSKANEMQLKILTMKTLGMNLDDPTVMEDLEKTIFHEMENMRDMAEFLIKHGADVNKESALGTPLMNAVSNMWNADIVDLLIKSGADVNKQDKDGRTALFYAYASGNDDLVTKLIKAGADVTLKDNMGQTYLEIEKIDMVQ